MNTKLRNRRAEEGVTQTVVAKKSHISERQYIRIERGERIPRADTAILIARALNSTVEELFGAATPAIEKEPGGNRT